MTATIEERIEQFREIGVDVRAWERAYRRSLTDRAQVRAVTLMNEATREARALHKWHLKCLLAYLPEREASYQLETLQVQHAGDDPAYWAATRRLLTKCERTIPPRRPVPRYGAAGGAPGSGERP